MAARKPQFDTRAENLAAALARSERVARELEIDRVSYLIMDTEGLTSRSMTDGEIKKAKRFLAREDKRKAHADAQAEAQRKYREAVAIAARQDAERLRREISGKVYSSVAPKSDTEA